MALPFEVPRELFPVEHRSCPGPWCMKRPLTNLGTACAKHLALLVGCIESQTAT